MIRQMGSWLKARLTGNLLWKPETFWPICGVALLAALTGYLGILLQSNTLLLTGCGLGGVFLLLILPAVLVPAVMSVFCIVVLLGDLVHSAGGKLTGRSVTSERKDQEP